MQAGNGRLKSLPYKGERKSGGRFVNRPYREDGMRGGSKPPPYREGTIPGVAERSESSNKMLAGGKHTATM